MPKDYTGFQGGNRRRRQFAARYGAAIGSIAMLLGGIVSFGSNVSTLRQTTAAMSAAEVLRSDLISKIDLRVVGDRTRKPI